VRRSPRRLPDPGEAETSSVKDPGIELDYRWSAAG